MKGWVNVACHECRQLIRLSEQEYQFLKRSGQAFFCLWGHSGVFAKGPTEEDRLRQERDRLKQENARLEERARAAERAEAALHEHAAHLNRKAAAARGQVTRLKNRAKAGLCPCCNRSFANLWAHMQDQHPEWEAEEVNLESGVVEGADR